MLETIVLKFNYICLHAEWLIVSQYSFSFSSLVKELHYLVKNNNIQNKDHVSYPHLLLVRRRLSITGQ